MRDILWATAIGSKPTNPLRMQRPTNARKTSAPPLSIVLTSTQEALQGGTRCHTLVIACNLWCIVCHVLAVSYRVWHLKRVALPRIFAKRAPARTVSVSLSHGVCWPMVGHCTPSSYWAPTVSSNPLMNCTHCLFQPSNELRMFDTAGSYMSACGVLRRMQGRYSG